MRGIQLAGCKVMNKNTFALCVCVLQLDCVSNHIYMHIQGLAMKRKHTSVQVMLHLMKVELVLVFTCWNLNNTSENLIMIMWLCQTG